MNHVLRIAAVTAGIIVLATSCVKEPDYPKPRPVPETAEQTVLMYMSGTDLVPFFNNNIAKAQIAVNNYILKDSRLLVFVQPTYSQALLLELRYDYEKHRCVVDTLADYGTEFCSTIGENITKLITDIKTTYAPAKRYGMIMGSHATGWIPSSYKYLTMGLRGKYEEYEDFWRKPDGRPHMTRWFGVDKSRAGDITELAAALNNTGIKFQYIIFDACFMSSIEALYDLRDAADYIAGSPCEIMGYGLPYDMLLPYLFTGENGEGYDIYGACRQFYEFYSTTTVTEQSGCIAVTKCSELKNMADVMKQVNEGKKKQYDKNVLQIYEGLSTHVFYDLGHYVKTMCDDPAALDKFSSQFDKTFPQDGRLHTPSFYSDYDGGHHTISDYSGVSVSEPSSKFQEDNRQTAWYIATH